jgi:hypothetical protein
MLTKPVNLTKITKFWRFIAYLIVVLSICPVQSYGEVSFSANREVFLWIDSLRTAGIVLSHEDFHRLHEEPFCVVEQLGRTVNKYEQLLHAIESKKNELQTRYDTEEQSDEQYETILLAQDYLESIIYEILFPMWVGIDWDFFGVPGKVPNSRKPIACGHLLEKLLKDTGFVVQRKQGTRLAYLSPVNFITSIQGFKAANCTNWKSILSYLKEHGTGLYFLGLDAGWGHVLLGCYLGAGDLWLLHSGPHPQGASVNIDDGEQYLKEYLSWQQVWITKLDTSLTLKWLIDSPIVPCVVMD